MEWVSGNILIRPNKLRKAGDKVDGHKHNFDHTSIVFSGSVSVRAKLSNGQIVERKFGDGPDCFGRHFLVKADVEHEITALVDYTEFWCIYSHRTPQGDITQVFTGWNDPYV